MAERNAAKVLPEPVGAATKTCRPAKSAGHAATCASVGAAKVRENHAATAGWNELSTLTGKLGLQGKPRVYPGISPAATPQPSPPLLDGAFLKGYNCWASNLPKRTNNHERSDSSRRGQRRQGWQFQIHRRHPQMQMRAGAGDRNHQGQRRLQSCLWLHQMLEAAR